VVTVSYGSAHVLEHFLASVRGATSGRVAVVVADNKAPDPEVERITERTGARYLPLSRNEGYGAGMNSAVKVLPAEVEWVLVSNPDVELGEGAIDALLASATSDPTIGAVGPAIMTDGLVYPSARSIPSLRTGVGHALFANIWVANPWTRSYRRDSESEPVRREAGWLSGACLLVRRSTFERLGGFDADYFMYFEDVDLGYRLGKAGYRNIYEPAAIVSHSGAHSTDGDSARMIEAHHQSARRFLGRKYAGWYLWPVRVALTVGLSIRSASLKRRATHH
jgi:N-acetylglucosaminyl-diphospho-decaprenol L-rhamnosyltransferase